MMGQIIPAGTGESMVFLDEMKLLDVKPKKKKIAKKTKQNVYYADNLELDLNVDGLEPDKL